MSDASNDRRLLVVPLHLKGIYVDKPMTTVGPTVDFSYLPWNDGQRDYNPDYAPLGEYLETTPLQSANGQLQSGIHLHWTLPPALCRKLEVKKGDKVLPFVPVKWNIVPIQQDGGEVLPSKTLWSDYLHPEKYPINLKYASIPVHNKPKKQPSRYMGIATALNESPPKYKVGKGEIDPDYYHKEDYLNHPLTSMGYGSLGFASYYPDCREVFGHHISLGISSK